MRSAPAVIDTNVVVSGVLTENPASPTVRILDGMLAGRLRFLLSVDLLAEYRNVLLRPRIRRRHRLAPTQIDVLLTEIAANGAVVETEALSGSTGKGDAHLWRLLDAVRHAILITGDRRLVDDPSRRGRVLLPRTFAETLEE
jgi:uncharacterized protein